MASLNAFTIIISQAVNSMSDLTLLFANQSTRSPVFSKTQSAGPNVRSSPFTTTSRILVSPTRQDSDLGNNLNKYLKDGLEKDSLHHELRKFTIAQKKQLGATLALFTVLFSIICYILPVESRVNFYLCLLFVLELLPLLAFRLAQQPIFLRGIPIVKPMVYATITYYILKSLAEVDLNAFNLDMTILTFIVVSLRLCVHYFEPIMLISTEQYRHQQVVQKSFLKKMGYFPFYLWERFRLLFRIKILLFSIIFIEESVFYALSIRFNSHSKEFLGILNLFYAASIFLLLEIFIELCRFIPHLFIEDNKTLVDKIPIYLKLLRLVPRNSYSSAVQKKCLYNLSLKINQVHGFLATENCKMGIFKNYMKVFEWYVIKQLENHHEKITKRASQVTKCQRIYKKEKTMLQDFFIPVRKACARVTQHYSMRQILSILVSVNSIVQVIAVADQHSSSAKEGDKLSQRVRQLLVMIEEKIRDSQESSIGRNNILVSELQAYRRYLESVAYCMRSGWTK